MEILHWWGRRRIFHNIALSPEKFFHTLDPRKVISESFHTLDKLPLLTVSPSGHFRNLIVVLIFGFSVGPKYVGLMRYEVYKAS